MSAVLDFNNKIQTMECSVCGIVYGLPFHFIGNRQDDKQTFYCPNGHTQKYVQSEADRLRQQLQKEREATEWQRARANQLEKSLTAQKGQMTKLKKRINNGVCPCCRRSFAALAQHMRRKHPDYVDKEQP